MADQKKTTGKTEVLGAVSPCNGYTEAQRFNLALIESLLHCGFREGRR
jgi:hypothetical protein